MAFLANANYRNIVVNLSLLLYGNWLQLAYFEPIVL